MKILLAVDGGGDHGIARSRAVANLVLGSVAQKVLAACLVPVLLVR